jgi:hypothetical protein
MFITIHHARVAAALLLSTTSIAVAGCGSSPHRSTASSSTTSTAASSTAPTRRPSVAATHANAHLAALDECLRKHGIALLAGAQGLISGGVAVRLPPGIAGTEYNAALKRCGGRDIAATLGGRQEPRSKLQRNPAFKVALASFTACMRGHGVNMPAPNVSGAGSIFNTKGVNTKSPQFAAAVSKCRSALEKAFHPAS